MAMICPSRLRMAEITSSPWTLGHRWGKAVDDDTKRMLAVWLQDGRTSLLPLDEPGTEYSTSARPAGTIQTRYQTTEKTGGTLVSRSLTLLCAPTFSARTTIIIRRLSGGGTPKKKPPVCTAPCSFRLGKRKSIHTKDECYN